jgi:histidinol phosphatase-like enzyme
MSLDITAKDGTIKAEKDTQKEVASLDRSEWQFDNDTIAALSDLGDIFRRIRTRMNAEGYTIVNGKVEKLPTAKL